VSPNDLAEVFLHTAVYAGVPNSNRAFELGKNALADAVGSTEHDTPRRNPRPSCSLWPAALLIRAFDAESASNARVPNWSEMASMSALVSVKAGVSASKGTGAVNVLGSTMSAPAKSGDSHGSVNAILGSAWSMI
jgi:hypothetical protein